MNINIDYSILIYNLLLLCVQVVFCRKYLLKFTYSFVKGNELQWSKEEDRIRVFGSSIILIASSAFLMRMAGERDAAAIGMYSLFSTTLTALLLFMYFKTPITHATKDVKQPEISDEVLAEKKNKDFELGFSEAELNSLYENLIDELLIEELSEDANMDGNQKFVQTLYSGQLPLTPMFKLNFDNPQTKLFIKFLNSRNTLVKNSQKLTFRKFLDIFQNNNGTPTPASLSTSSSKSTSEPKNKGMIEKLFILRKEG